MKSSPLIRSITILTSWLALIVVAPVPTQAAAKKSCISSMVALDYAKLRQELIENFEPLLISKFATGELPKEIVNLPIFKFSSNEKGFVGSLYIIKDRSQIYLIGEYEKGVFSKKLQPFFAILQGARDLRRYTLEDRFYRTVNIKKGLVGLTDGPVLPTTINLGEFGALKSISEKSGFRLSTGDFALEPRQINKDVQALSPEELIEQMKASFIELND